MKDDLFENARPESTKLRLVLAWLCQSKAKPSHLKIKVRFLVVNVEL